MKLIFSILGATVCCSLFPLAAQENYSLWPRRPDELRQARRLIEDGHTDTALDLLRPFINKTGLAGREARRLVSSVRTRIYFTPLHPRTRTHTVRRGENIERIASAYRSSPEFIILLNGLMNPSSLRIGQHLRVAPVDLRAEIHLTTREVSMRCTTWYLPILTHRKKTPIPVYDPSKENCAEHVYLAPPPSLRAATK